MSANLNLETTTKPGTASVPRKAATDINLATFTPIMITEVDIAHPLPTIEGTNPESTNAYKAASVLVRWNKQPIGMVMVHLEAGRIAPSTLAAVIWQELYDDIGQHLLENTQLRAVGLSVDGLATAEVERVVPLEDMPFISIVISTHERPHLLERCLESLVTLRYVNYEVIVVDNVPKTNGTARLVNEFIANYPDTVIRYLCEMRQGLSHGRNRGAREAQGEILLFTDDDIIADAEWLVQTARGFDAGENVGCVTGLILPMELETAAQHWLEQYGGFAKGFRRRLFDLKEYKPKETNLFPYTMGLIGSGANMAFRANVMEEIGYFDILLAGENSIGGEDLMAYFSVLDRNYQIAYEPGAIIFHKHHREYAKLQRQIFNYGAGYAAFITRVMMRQPWRILPLLYLLPRGQWYLLSLKSPKNVNKQIGYPAELSWLERRGLFHGPVKCLRNWGFQQRLRHQERRTNTRLARSRINKA